MSVTVELTPRKPWVKRVTMSTLNKKEHELKSMKVAIKGLKNVRRKLFWLAWSELLVSCETNEEKKKASILKHLTKKAHSEHIRYCACLQQFALAKFRLGASGNRHNDFRGQTLHRRDPRNRAIS